MPKIKLIVNTGFANAKHTDFYDYPDDEWNLLSEEEKEEELTRLALEYLYDRTCCEAFVVE